MSFAVPDFSPGEVRRAGETLRDPNSTELALHDAAAVLSRWRAVHLYPMNTFQATLRDRMGRIGTAKIVGQRLKRAPSVIAKLRDRPTMRLQQMQDIAGLRAIVSNMGKLRSLEDMYLSGRLSHDHVAMDDYIAAPKDDGYRSIHLIYKYNNVQAPTYNGLHVELQLRTKLQHAWATAVETVDVFMAQSIKAGRPTPEWGRFFTLASAAFAQLEGCAPVPGYEGVSLGRIVPRLRDSEHILNVLARLRGFRVATNVIMSREANRSSFLHLVVLNTETRYLTYRSFSESQQEEANLAYTEAEQRQHDGEPVDPVLVAGGNLRQLKKSYPNYFADTAEFVQKIEAVTGRVP